MLITDDNALPSFWEDMKGDLVKLVALTVGSKEYTEVESELRKTLQINIITVCSPINTTVTIVLDFTL